MVMCGEFWYTVRMASSSLNRISVLKTGLSISRFGLPASRGPTGPQDVLPQQQQKRRPSVSARLAQRSQPSPGAVAESEAPRSFSSGRAADLAATVSDLAMLTERIRDQYKDYLDRAKREAHGEEEQILSRLAELDDAA